MVRVPESLRRRNRFGQILGSRWRFPHGIHHVGNFADGVPVIRTIDRLEFNPLWRHGLDAEWTIPVRNMVGNLLNDRAKFWTNTKSRVLAVGVPKEWQLG